MDTHEQGRGIDRRTLIRRGALVAGAAWTAPLIVESLASPAGAVSVCTNTAVCSLSSPSSSCTWYAFRVSSNSTSCDVIGGGNSVCPSTTSALTTLANAGIVVQNTCPPGTVILSSTTTGMKIQLPSTCNVAQATVFAGAQCCTPSVSTVDCTFTYTNCVAQGISHIDFIVCCCPA